MTVGMRLAFLAVCLTPASLALAGDADGGLDLRPPLPEGAQAERVNREAQYLQAQASGDASAEELAKKLSNPVASLISVPFQYNLGINAGDSNHGWQHILNVQPVIPITLNKDWNLIVRTIVPIIYQDDIVDDGGSSQIGLGDTTQSFFLSPSHSDPIWGIGPVIFWPSATNDSLGQQQWGLGITGLVLKQDGPWTYGVLANHIWSVADHGGDRPYISTTFIQPFLSYNTKTGFGVTIQAETTYDWNAEEWTVPIGLFASQVFKLGGQHMQANFGPRVWAEGPDGAPEWGLRFTLTFMFPK